MFDYRNFALIVRVRSFDLSRITQPASHVIIRIHIDQTSLYDHFDFDIDDLKGQLGIDHIMPSLGHRSCWA